MAQPKLTLTRLSKIEIPTCPIDEQRMLVARVDAIRRKIHGTEEVLLSKVNDLQNLKASILNAAFKRRAIRK